MKKKIAWIGLDVHKKSITGTVFLGNSEKEEFTQRMPNNIGQLIKWLKKLGKNYHLRVCYEAGGCGYSIYRKLANAGIDCIVVAPSLVPKEQRKVKTDRLDSIKLGKYLRGGLLSGINVPTEELESDRDKVRFRASQVGEESGIKQRILAFLLRKDIKYAERVSWSRKFVNWLGTLELAEGDRKTLRKYLDHYEYQKKFVKELTEDLENLSQEERYIEMVRYLKGFRGIETITAMTIATHVPDFRAFPSPKKFMSYIGLTPGEDSSGESIKHKGITKTGNNLLRKAFLTVAQQYSKPDKVGRDLGLRRKDLPTSVLGIVQRADRRCRRRYYALLLKGKHVNKVKTAVAREIASFVWEVMMLYYRGELRIAV